MTPTHDTDKIMFTAQVDLNLQEKHIRGEEFGLFHIITEILA